MMRSFKHRGLKRFYEHGDRSRLGSANIQRVEDIIARLDVSLSPADLDLPGYALHALKGALQGFWSVHVSGNWRIIFRFQDGDVFDVNLVDYH